MSTEPEPSPCSLRPNTPDQLIALLGVYAGQVASYTNLLWQVPALGLTAQAFLLTIALTKGNGHTAKVVVAALSMVIAVASYFLMHDQRGRAINYGELAKQLSGKLELKAPFFDEVDTDDGVPRKTNAEDIWTWHGKRQVVAGRITRMYAAWRFCLLLFFFVDIGIILSVWISLKAAIWWAAGIGVLISILILVISNYSDSKAEREKEEKAKPVVL